jgi:hypothetical protein
MNSSQVSTGGQAGFSKYFRRLNSGKWPWLLIAVVALGFTVLLAGAVHAQDAIKIVVNGQEVTSDVPPQIVDGRTLVPLRTVADALGAQVDWDAASNSVIVTQDASQTIKVNGEQTTWPFWYEDGNLYLEYHDAMALLRMAHSSTMYSIDYSLENHYLTVNDGVYTVPSVKEGNYDVISITYIHSLWNLIDFSFDPQTGSLTLLSSTGS